MNSDKGLFQLNQAAVAMSATMLDVKKSTSAFGKAMERLVMTTVHSATARTKIDRLTAVLDAVLDWPTEEVRPFAEQVYHLVNNPELTADDVRSGTLIHQQLQVLQGGDSLDRASRAEYEAIMDEYIRRQITQPPTTPRVV